ncbi:MAG: DUF2283 domain-containing protein [Candidatus Rokuibacteriota bacterium]
MKPEPMRDYVGLEARSGRIVLQSKVAMDVPTRSYPVGGGRMKVTYDPRTDTLNVTLREDAQVAESDEDKPGVILDYDSDGNLVSLEILDASKRVTDARKVEFQMVS